MSNNDLDSGYYMLFRCTTRKYAKQMLENGSLKFNTPQSWVDSYFKYGPGQGDDLEGTFLACRHVLSNVIATQNLYYKQENEDVFIYTKDDRLYFKHRQSMSMPGYCIYALKTALFTDQIKSPKGIQNITYRIDKRYFRDFALGKTIQEINDLPEEDKPAVVLIEKPEEFQHRLTRKLISMGFSQEEIFSGYARYAKLFDPNEPDYYFIYDGKPPTELFIKSSDFSYQNELRYIINSNKTELCQKLLADPIEIGSLLDIAVVFEEYFEDGLDITVKFDFSKQI